MRGKASVPGFNPDFARQLESTFIPRPKGVESDALALFEKAPDQKIQPKGAEAPRGRGRPPNVKPVQEIPETHLLPDMPAFDSV